MIIIKMQMEYNFSAEMGSRLKINMVLMNSIGTFVAKNLLPKSKS